MYAVQPAPTELRQDGLCVAHHQLQPTSAAHYGSNDRLSYSRLVPVTVRPGRLRSDDADPGSADCFSCLRCTAPSTQHLPLRSDVRVSVASLCICSELTGLLQQPANLLQHLQSVQNSAARLIYRLRSLEHITDTLLSLDWLRVREANRHSLSDFVTQAHCHWRAIFRQLHYAVAKG